MALNLKSKDLPVGTVIVVNGNRYTLDRRKTEQHHKEPGWWLAEGGGYSDVNLDRTLAKLDTVVELPPHAQPRYRTSIKVPEEIREFFDAILGVAGIVGPDGAMRGPAKDVVDVEFTLAHNETEYDLAEQVAALQDAIGSAGWSVVVPRPQKVEP